MNTALLDETKTYPSEPVSLVCAGTAGDELVSTEWTQHAGVELTTMGTSNIISTLGNQDSNLAADLACKMLACSSFPVVP
jgi:hypothetical protein